MKLTSACIPSSGITSQVRRAHAADGTMSFQLQEPCSSACFRKSPSILASFSVNGTFMLDYKTHADNDSMYNTPPTFAIYMAGLVFQWLKKNGGIGAMECANIAKAELLYAAIDASNGFYHCPVNKADRSRMNVPFTLKDANMDGDFLKQADERGLLQLKGHRSVGGMRASIYNAMPLEGVQALVNFMNEFVGKHG